MDALTSTSPSRQAALETSAKRLINLLIGHEEPSFDKMQRVVAEFSARLAAHGEPPNPALLHGHAMGVLIHRV